MERLKGIIFIVFSSMKLIINWKRCEIHSKNYGVDSPLFSDIVGMLIVQFALVAAINESNAVLFTLLQFFRTDIYYCFCLS